MLSDSLEAVKIEQDHGASIEEFDSYEEVLEAVRLGEVRAGNVEKRRVYAYSFTILMFV